MTFEDFEKCFESRVEKCRTVLIQKNLEYARGGDKLSNFKTAGAMQREHPAKALQGMMAKHQISIVDLVNDLNKGLHSPRAVWDEKLGDALNYLFLLDAIVREEDFKEINK